MAKKAAKTKRRKPAPRAKLALAQSSHPSPIYKHVPGGGLVRCIWNDADNQYDCGPINEANVPNGAGIYPPS